MINTNSVILIVLVVAIIFIRRYLNNIIKQLYRNRKRNETLMKFYKENLNKTKKYQYQKMLENSNYEIKKAEKVKKIILFVLIVSYLIVFLLVEKDDIIKILP